MKGKDLLKKCSSSFRKMSIQRVITFSFTTAAVAGILFFGFSMTLRYSSLNQEIRSAASEQVINQVNQSMDRYIRRMMGLCDTLYYRVIKNKDLEQESLSYGLQLLYEENRSDVATFALFDSKGELLTCMPSSMVPTQVSPLKQTWFQSSLEQLENIHFSKPHVQEVFQPPSSESRWVVSVSRQVELTKGKTTQSGVFLMDLKFSGVAQICKGANYNTSGYLFLTDASGELIYHPKQQLIYAGVMEEDERLSALSDGTHITTYQGVQRQVTVKTVGYTGWKLIGVVPVETLAGNTTRFTLFVVSLLLFSIFLLLFLNTKISAHISEPIRELERAILEIEKGKDFPETSGQGCYEVRRLEHSLRSMVSTMRHLMDDVIRQEREKRKGELDVLQSQINPHFLYNTLDSVIWLTESQRYEDAITMVTALGKLFRISLSKGKSVIPVSQEIEHAKNYMAIQNVRYKNKFEFILDVQPGLENLTTLKLILQPVLENAIYHGMAGVYDDGEIRLKVRREGDDLYFEVQDNGLGMTPEKAAGLLDPAAPEIRSKGSGIGVRNVNQRIQLTYGKEYGLTFFSEPDEGTTVVIHIPAVEEEGGEQP